MKEIRTEDAVGHILCHDITQIIKDEKKGGFWICKENGLYADVLGFTSYFEDIEQLIKFVQSLRND